MRFPMFQPSKAYVLTVFAVFSVWNLMGCSSSSSSEHDASARDAKISPDLKAHLDQFQNQNPDGETLLADLGGQKDNQVILPDQSATFLDVSRPDTKSPDLLVLKDKGIPDASWCLKPGPQCWDVTAVFFITDYELYPVEIFGQVVADNQKIYAFLDGTKDDTYTTPGYICLPYYSTPKPKALTWDIERIPIDEKNYRLLVRGQSDQDCDKGQANNAGEIEVNLARGWKITKTNACGTTPDIPRIGPSRPGYCEVRPHKVAWQAGSGCGGCCNCPDGSYVNIDVTVTKE